MVAENAANVVTHVVARTVREADDGQGFFAIFFLFATRRTQG